MQNRVRLVAFFTLPCFSQSQPRANFNSILLKNLLLPTIFTLNVIHPFHALLFLMLIIPSTSVSFVDFHSYFRRIHKNNSSQIGTQFSTLVRSRPPSALLLLPRTADLHHPFYGAYYILFLFKNHYQHVI